MSDANPEVTANAEKFAGIALSPLPDVADALGVSIIDVHKLLKDGRLVAVLDGQGRRCVPEAFLEGGAIVKALPSVITLLRDARFTDEEVVDWMFRPDDTLPGTPAQALLDNRGTEIKRRAQASGY
ncbi:MAG: transcriptional regulatory protein [Frankiales bacterium]|jgi:hypothetical protein|nr:transcriptional regulatory protein [Frankiales bacterium]